MNAPSVLIAAAGSGTGKTMLTIGLLSALRERGLRVISFKCGPDYIDPMFHRKVLTLPSRNLDSFLMGEERLKARFEQNTKGFDLAVIEGVMGYYDGLGGVSTKASAYDVACLTGAKTLLLVNVKGMSVSVLAQIKGFLEFRDPSHIAGVILNRVSPMMYPRMKKMIEGELPVKVFGYIPQLEWFQLTSRHLGLVLPDEYHDIREQISRLGKELAKSLEMDELLAELGVSEAKTEVPKAAYETKKAEDKIRIGLAKDEAFCFMYEDNLEILESLGAEPVPFSPMRDEKLPEDLDGLIFYGGYPELYADVLSANGSMRQQVLAALRGGMPCIAECGGFMYLHEEMEDGNGNAFPMAGFVEGRAFKTNRLNRFGYAYLTEGSVFGERAGELPIHEFHYFDTTNPGEAFAAYKPLSDKKWRCMISGENVLMGFPHFHYDGSPEVAEGFMRAARSHKEKR